MNYISNTLTPRTAEKYLNDAATISDNVPNKMTLVKPVLQWVGDNITTLRDRQLLNNMDKSQAQHSFMQAQKHMEGCRECS